MPIGELTISFPDFKLNEIIDPEQHDQNNADITDKINELITQSNVLSTDGYVGTSQLADGAVVTIKLADGAVVEAKIANDSVTSVKILNGSVVEAKIADGAVTTAKVADGAIINSKIANGVISIGKLNIPTLDTYFANKTDVNASLLNKTDKIGNHEGRWHGLLPTDINGGGQAIDLSQVKLDLKNHKENTSNPHSVTAEQIGAYHSGSLENMIADMSYNTSVDLSSVDSKGVYLTVYQKRRSDDSIAIKQTLSNPNANGYYTTLTEAYYELDGITVKNTLITTITYDDKGKIVGSVVI